MTRTEVGSVASFYTMYYRQPVGRHMVHVCTDLPCALAGADEMYAAMRAKLGLKDGDTTDDGAITLREAECLGGCNHAVVALVDGAEHLEDLTAEKIDVLIARLRK
jgi:NADH-quinone oxidoreductase subunit E